MTDYNDGKWHVWNGGECPVPGASGYITYSDGVKANYGCEAKFDNYDWGQPLMFRVVKPAPPKPKEIWVNENRNGYFAVRMSEEKARQNAGSDAIRIAVRYREVLE